MILETKRNSLLESIKTVTIDTFEPLALDIFRYQSKNNPIYAQFLELLQINQAEVQQIADIPFLPISLFKKYEIKTADWQEQQIFSSSGTTGSIPSRHYLRDQDFYKHNARRAFEQFYGSLKDYTVLALLPSYLERSGSSLIFMAQDFIEQSADTNSGFFLNNYDALLKRIAACQDKGKKILLLGVSFALLDLAEKHPQALENTIIMETGGMKGRREEITRDELHHILKTAFKQEKIHSEYGMTELLSQAYSLGDGIFHPAPSMRILTREITDPLSAAPSGKTGGVNIIDLANIDTISFIATDDLAIVEPDHSFSILGRLDAGDVRGCNLMFKDV